MYSYFVYDDMHVYMNVEHKLFCMKMQNDVRCMK